MNSIQEWLHRCHIQECGGDLQLLEKLGGELQCQNSKELVLRYVRHMRAVFFIEQTTKETADAMARKK